MSHFQEKLLCKHRLYVILICRIKSQRFALLPCLSLLAQNNIPHTMFGHVHLLITYIHLRNTFIMYSAVAIATKTKANKCNLRTVAMLLFYTQHKFRKRFTFLKFCITVHNYKSLNHEEIVFIFDKYARFRHVGITGCTN